MTQKASITQFAHPHSNTNTNPFMRAQGGDKTQILYTNILKTLLILSFTMSITVHVDAQIPTDGLLGYWSFSENLLDDSGNGNDGTLAGSSLASITDRFGNANSAYEFNGINNYVNVGTDFSFTNELTVSAWVKTNNIPNVYGCIVEKYFSANNGGFLLRVVNTTPVEARIGGRDHGSNFVRATYADLSILDNSWHHLVGVIDNNTWQLWVDGDLAGTTTTTTVAVNIASSDPMIIGNYINGGDNKSLYFDGAIDDIRVYNVALNSTQIGELYNEPNPGGGGGGGGPSLWTENNGKIYYNSGNVGIGIINPPAKLTVNGAILGTQIKVQTDVSMFPDFVFDPDYPLMTITEVDNYIQTHGHLPDIPTAQEAVSDGHDIGAMNLKLLQKIEELTLYAIEQECQIIDQNKKIKNLTLYTINQEKKFSKIETLENQITQLIHRIKKLENDK